MEQEKNQTETIVEDQNNDEVNEQPESDVEQTEVTEELSEEQQKINELEQQVSDLNSRLLRTHADFDNFRRRTKEEKEAAAKYRAQSLVEELLSVLDNFERALAVEPTNDETKTLLQGMEMVHRQLQDAMQKEGVEVIEAVGQTFDPHLHQAVMQVDSDEHEPNTVIEEFQKGYKLKDRVIRPSMVKVNG
ncbi:nucleotide exchange factor GrpE [Alkalihalobacterium alkalinitrilicum]|uniref:nucleotide exchange factor GrpE n=1 Tax=Alkalihalobacterium alkalinitrilicum TaxID=427920 RepID=UPI001EE3E227|nr:nucleotide exchange factor GrpE [Alkalihalobacterium alkalinitrilicum]